MAGASIWDALGGIVTNLGQAYLSNKQTKAAQKALNSQVAIARYQAKSVMPTLGMGYAATPLGGGGQIASLPAGFNTGAQAMPASYDIGRALQIDPTSLVGGMMGLRASNRVTNPRTGKADTCLLWSSDLVAARRVGKVARKLGRFVHHRRPR